MSTVGVEFTKWPGSAHWHYEMTVLGDDEHGIWLGAPLGTVLQRGEEPPRAHPYGFVTLVPDGTWWTAIFNEGDIGKYEVYVDVSTPARWEGDRLRMIDLDLDVVRYRTGGVAILDEDEFEEHRRLFDYPARVVDAALGAAARLFGALEERAEPFGVAAAPWLGRLAEIEEPGAGE